MQSLTHVLGKKAHPWSRTDFDTLPSSLGKVPNKEIHIWRCENGHEWSASLFTQKRRMTCPKCFPANTSQPEQTLFDHMKQIFPSTQNRADVFYRGKHIELDIFIPELKLAIAYDGPHHATRAHKDEEQNYLLGKLGFHLIRVRVLGLPELQSSCAILLNHEVHNRHSLQACLCSIGDYMKDHFQLAIEQIKAIEAWQSPSQGA